MTGCFLDAQDMVCWDQVPSAISMLRSIQ